MGLRSDELTTVQIDKLERDSLRDTLEVAIRKLDKRRYYMPDMIKDMHEHWRKYLDNLPEPTN